MKMISKRNHKKCFSISEQGLRLKLRARRTLGRMTYFLCFPSLVHQQNVKMWKTIFSPSLWLKTTSWLAFLHHLYPQQHQNPTISQFHRATWATLATMFKLLNLITLRYFQLQLQSPIRQSGIGISHSMRNILNWISPLTTLINFSPSAPILDSPVYRISNVVTDPAIIMTRWKSYDDPNGYH